ncbi:MAG: encapsulin, partial [Acidithiobacillus sp.]|nr:encapsulin [Acidithiobacillus sp.]
MDMILNGRANGSVAQRLMANGMNPLALKPWIGSDGQVYMTQIVNGKAQAIPLHVNATLRKDEWKEIDQAVVMAAQDRMVGVADLYSRNLVCRIGNGLGKTVLEYEDIDDLTDAELTMDAITPSKKDRPNYELKYLPLPIVHKDFSYNARVLAASRTTGQPIDTTTAALASRRVIDKVETMLFQGASSYAYGGGTLYGYLDHPQRNIVTLTLNWDNASKTGENILDDVKSMKQASIDAKHYGP